MLMPKQGKRSAIWLLFMTLTAGCATSGSVPVAVSCPQPPPLPQILTESVSAEPPLIEGWSKLMESYRQALSRSFAEAMRE